MSASRRDEEVQRIAALRTRLQTLKSEVKSPMLDNTETRLEEVRRECQGLLSDAEVLLAHTEETTTAALSAENEQRKEIAQTMDLLRKENAQLKGMLEKARQIEALRKELLEKSKKEIESLKASLADQTALTKSLESQLHHQQGASASPSSASPSTSSQSTTTTTTTTPPTTVAEDLQRSLSTSAPAAASPLTLSTSAGGAATATSSASPSTTLVSSSGSDDPSSSVSLSLEKLINESDSRVRRETLCGDEPVPDVVVSNIVSALPVSLPSSAAASTSKQEQPGRSQFTPALPQAKQSDPRADAAVIEEAQALLISYATLTLAAPPPPQLVKIKPLTLDDHHHNSLAWCICGSCSKIKFLQSRFESPEALARALYSDIRVDSIEAPTRTGFLTKQGGSMKSWKRRFVVLKDNFLFYYKKQRDEAPLGVVQVEEAGVGEATESDRKNVFRVETKTRTWLFQADRQVDMELWIICLQKVRPWYLIVDQHGAGAEDDDDRKKKRLLSHALRLSTYLGSSGGMDSPPLASGMFK